MDIIENLDVEKLLNSYPKIISAKLSFLRDVIFETASEIEGCDQLEETFKWGEPSYIVKNGSTIRMDWKQKHPDQYCLYFNCKTKLVDTFKELYRDILKFEGNRAIVFDINDEIPISELKHCIRLSLTYHNVKHIPMLGA